MGIFWYLLEQHSHKLKFFDMHFSFSGIGDFFPKDDASSEVSPEKPSPSVANECPGTSSEAQGIEGIEEIVED